MPVTPMIVGTLPHDPSLSDGFRLGYRPMPAGNRHYSYLP